MSVTLVPPPDRCTCTVRMFEGKVQRVVKETCPEHGRWARHAKAKKP